MSRSRVGVGADTPEPGTEKLVSEAAALGAATVKEAEAAEKQQDFSAKLEKEAKAIVDKN